MGAVSLLVSRILHTQNVRARQWHFHVALSCSYAVSKMISSCLLSLTVQKCMFYSMKSGLSRCIGTQSRNPSPAPGGRRPRIMSWKPAWSTQGDSVSRKQRMATCSGLWLCLDHLPGTQRPGFDPQCGGASREPYKAVCFRKCSRGEKAGAGWDPECLPLLGLLSLSASWSPGFISLLSFCPVFSTGILSLAHPPLLFSLASNLSLLLFL